MTRPFKYFNPIFTRGQTNVVNPAGGTYNDGDTVITFDNSGGQYVVGSHVFGSLTNNIIPEYLGQATAADVSSITVELDLSRGFTADQLKIWQPTKFWRPIWGIGPNMQKLAATGTETVEPSGGGAVNTQTAATLEKLLVEVDKIDLSEGDLNNWLVFLFVDLSSGTKRCNLSFFDQEKNRSRMATVLLRQNNTIGLWNMDTALLIGAFAETFIVLADQEDSFITST